MEEKPDQGIEPTLRARNTVCYITVGWFFIFNSMQYNINLAITAGSKSCDEM